MVKKKPPFKVTVKYCNHLDHDHTLNLHKIKTSWNCSIDYWYRPVDHTTDVLPVMIAFDRFDRLLEALYSYLNERFIAM